MYEFPYPQPVAGVGRIVASADVPERYADASVAWTGYPWRSGVFGWASSPGGDGRVLELIAVGRIVRVTRVHRRLADAIAAAQANYRRAIRSDLVGHPAG